MFVKKASILCLLTVLLGFSFEALAETPDVGQKAPEFTL